MTGRRRGPGGVNAIRLKLVEVRASPAKAALKVRLIFGASPQFLHPQRGQLVSRARGVGALRWLSCMLSSSQMMGPTFFSSQRFFGVPGDSQQYMWFIGWMWHAIELGHSPFVSHAFDYPHSIALYGLYLRSCSGATVWVALCLLTSVVFVYNLILVVNYSAYFALWQADATRTRRRAFVLEHWRLPVLPHALPHRAGPLTLASVGYRPAFLLWLPCRQTYPIGEAAWMGVWG